MGVGFKCGRPSEKKMAPHDDDVGLLITNAVRLLKATPISCFVVEPTEYRSVVTKVNMIDARPRVGFV